jgi:hypothetical protein
MNILNLFKNTDIDLEKTITLATNNGGVVTTQVQDALLFLEDTNIKEELSFLHHLVSSTQHLTQESITSFLKHLFFDSTLAKQFVQWQRSPKVA